MCVTSSSVSFMSCIGLVWLYLLLLFIFFFFNDTATTEIYTLSLHDALPICRALLLRSGRIGDATVLGADEDGDGSLILRSEEHTSELQSQSNLVCRLLLEKKKKYSQFSRCRGIVKLSLLLLCIAIWLQLTIE